MEKGFLHTNRVQLIQGGADFFSLLEKLIREAKESIHLQTYIFDDDETGQRIAGALRSAAQRGVKVYLLVDGYASQSLSGKWIQSLRQSGIRFRFFEPLFRSRYFYLGRRLHHKVVVVDTRQALVGGINISDHYNDLPGRPAWFDFALHLQGELARELCILCWKSWKGFPAVMGTTPCELQRIAFDIPEMEKSWVRMRRNDWVRRKNQISRTYLELLRTAQHEVIIVCSYFMPGRLLQKKLQQALQRGVKVKILLAGLSDVVMAKNAERYMYDWLLRNGVELYEFTGTVLHAKIAMADGQWYTVGSYNVNNISAYASVELNLDVRGGPTIAHTHQRLLQLLQQHSVRITTEQHLRAKNWIKQFGRWSSYQLIRVIFYLFTFYFKQHN